MRIRIPSRKHDPAYFQTVREYLSQVPDIASVEVNPLTGSVFCALGRDREGIEADMERGNLFKVVPVSTGKTTVAEKVFGRFKGVDAAVRDFTGGEVDIPSIAFLGLLGSALYEIALGNLTLPAWYVALWYAASIGYRSSGDSLSNS